MLTSFTICSRLNSRLGDFHMLLIQNEAQTTERKIAQNKNNVTRNFIFLLNLEVYAE